MARKPVELTPSAKKKLAQAKKAGALRSVRKATKGRNAQLNNIMSQIKKSRGKKR